MAKISKDNQPVNGDAVAKSNTKRRIMTETLLVALNREAKDCNGKKTKRLAIIADQLAQKAAEGDLQAIKEVFDRTDGRAAQAVELSGESGGPIVFKTVYESGG